MVRVVSATTVSKPTSHPGVCGRKLPSIVEICLLRRNERNSSHRSTSVRQSAAAAAHDDADDDADDEGSVWLQIARGKTATVALAVQLRRAGIISPPLLASLNSLPVAPDAADAAVRSGFADF